MIMNNKQRSIAREVVMKAVFEYLFNNEINNALIESLIDENQITTEQDYVAKTYYGIINNMEKLSEQIKKYAIGFSFDRIFKVDRAIMLVAIYEIMFVDDIDYKVSINEALNLAKKFSTEKSSKFINGILNQVAKNGNN